MNISYKKQFLKDLSRVPLPYRARIEELVFETVPSEDAVNIMQRVSKMKGCDGYYKIRISDYRIGVYIENHKLEFKRVLHRKEICRFFP